MFDNLNLPIPEAIYTLSNENQKEIYDYLSQLDEHKRQAYKIAFHHLGTSFSIYKSNGYKEWKNDKK